MRNKWIKDNMNELAYTLSNTSTSSLSYAEANYLLTNFEESLSAEYFTELDEHREYLISTNRGR